MKLTFLDLFAFSCTALATFYSLFQPLAMAMLSLAGVLLALEDASLYKNKTLQHKLTKGLNEFHC